MKSGGRREREEEGEGRNREGCACAHTCCMGFEGCNDIVKEKILS